MNLAVTTVVPLRATLVTVIPLPPLTWTVNGETKFVPDSVTSTGAEEFPVFGPIESKLGAALMTVNVLAAEVPNDVDTVTLRGPGAAEGEIVNVAAIEVELTS